MRLSPCPLLLLALGRQSTVGLGGPVLHSDGCQAGGACCTKDACAEEASRDNRLAGSSHTNNCGRMHPISFEHRSCPGVACHHSNVGHSVPAHGEREPSGDSPTSLGAHQQSPRLHGHLPGDAASLRTIDNRSLQCDRLHYGNEQPQRRVRLRRECVLGITTLQLSTRRPHQQEWRPQPSVLACCMFDQPLSHL